jgi:hypothetical protein
MAKRREKHRGRSADLLDPAGSEGGASPDEDLVFVWKEALQAAKAAVLSERAAAMPSPSDPAPARPAPPARYERQLLQAGAVSLAQFIQAFAQLLEQATLIEKATGTSMLRVTDLVGTDPFVAMVQDRLGPEGVAQLVALLLQLTPLDSLPLPRNPPDKNLQYAGDLRKAVAKLSELVRTPIPA